MKILTSPSKKWAGEVVLYDPLTMPQVRLIEDAIGINLKGQSIDGKIWTSVVDEKMLPAIIACVSEWKLGDFPKDITLETFPASPRKASHDLVSWLFGEIYKIYLGEIEVPNE